MTAGGKRSGDSPKTCSSLTANAPSPARRRQTNVARARVESVAEARPHARVGHRIGAKDRLVARAVLGTRDVVDVVGVGLEPHGADLLLLSQIVDDERMERIELRGHRGFPIAARARRAAVGEDVRSPHALRRACGDRPARRLSEREAAAGRAAREDGEDARKNDEERERSERCSRSQGLATPRRRV